MVSLFTYSLRPGRLIALEFISQFIENVVKVVLVLHDVEHELHKLLINLVDQSLQRLPLNVNQNDLNDVWELLVVHFLHKLLLILAYL